jgi:hypothetical protein
LGRSPSGQLLLAAPPQRLTIETAQLAAVPSDHPHIEQHVAGRIGALQAHHRCEAVGTLISRAFGLAQLRPKVLVKESFDRRVSMPPVMLPYESVLCPRVNHHIEGFAQVLQLAE